MELRFFQEFGTAAVATKSYAIGEVVLNERPLLAVLPDANLLSEAGHTFPKNPAFVAKLVAFARADPAVQERLKKLYSPDPAQWPQHGLVTLAKEAVAAAQASAVFQKVLQGYTTETLTEVILKWALNAHAFQSGAALFEWGSKLTHTCAISNTRFTSSEGRGVHVAVSPIQPGNLVTTNYLGERSLMSTPARRLLLQRSKMFWCRCKRCSKEVDTFRALPCPTCCAGLRDARGSLSPAAAAHQVPSMGFVYRTPTADGDAAPGTSGSGIWTCDTCSQSFGDTPKELFGEAYRPEFEDAEAKLEAAILGVDSFMEVQHAMHSDSVAALYGAASAVLGPRHWTANRAAALLADIDRSSLHRMLQAVEACGGGFGRGELAQAAGLVRELRSNTEQVWAWVDAHTAAEASLALAAMVQGVARTLLDAGTRRATPPTLRATCAGLAASLLRRLLPGAHADCDGQQPASVPEPERSLLMAELELADSILQDPHAPPPPMPDRISRQEEFWEEEQRVVEERLHDLKLAGAGLLAAADATAESRILKKSSPGKPKPQPAKEMLTPSEEAERRRSFLPGNLAHNPQLASPKGRGPAHKKKSKHSSKGR